MLERKKNKKLTFHGIQDKSLLENTNPTLTPKAIGHAHTQRTRETSNIILFYTVSQNKRVLRLIYIIVAIMYSTKEHFYRN